MNHSVVVMEKSRRTGISWAESWDAVVTASATKAAGGMSVYYMGYEKEMTREFIDYCAHHAKLLSLAASEVREEVFHDDHAPDKDIKVFRIDFASGFHITALPSVPRALRGKQGMVIIDEAAFHKDLNEVLKAALALLMWGGRVAVISTHNGDRNPFAELVNDVRAGRRPYHLMRLTLDDALEDGLYRKICEAQGKPWSQEAQAVWRAELMKQYGDAAGEELFCVPSQGKGAFIPLALIEARTDKAAPVVRWGCDDAFTLLSDSLRHAEAQTFIEGELEPILAGLNAKSPHVFGMDFARSGDLSVFWLFELASNNVRKTALELELRNVPFEQQKQILFHILEHTPRLRAGKMDAGGNGAWLAEVTRQKFGARVEAVSFSEGWYRDTMPPLKAAFEDGSLTVPVDREVHDDIRTLRLVNGVARVPQQRSKGEGGQRHGDAAVALALAYAASRTEAHEYAYTAVPSGWRAMQPPAGADRLAAELEQERAGRAGMNSWGLRGGVLL
ncbi:hypothetical protein E3E12_06080 [Formicincola oecophyllae]|uniref:Mu-like prophage FluMu protein gp28 n=2 Tax=Formicincola oecophyllae TaxID=2558361 RepID=A0A4Y6UEH6_9PROT|nr:hypothetical protein E3E12_06080 [Formicincola oecophyllae]